MSYTYVDSMIYYTLLIDGSVSCLYVGYVIGGFITGVVGGMFVS